MTRVSFHHLCCFGGRRARRPTYCDALRAALVLAGVAAAPCVWAGNAEEVLLGTDAPLVGGALVATARSGSAMWYNPAGLADAPYSSLDVSASAFTVRIASSPDLVRGPDGQPFASSVTEVVAIPTALTFTRRLGQRWIGAIGIFVPRLNDISYHQQVDLQTTIPSSWQIGVDSGLQRYHFAGAIGNQLTPWLRWGATVSVVYEHERTAVRATGLELIDNPSFVAVSQQLERHSIGLEVRAGAVFKLTEQWCAGVMLRSPTVFFGNDVTQATSQVASIVDAFGNGANGGAVSSDSELDFGVEAVTPFAVRFGSGYLAQWWSFAIGGDLTAPVKNAGLGIDETLEWNIRAGGTVSITPRWTVGLGVFSDRDANAAANRGVDYYGVSGGIRYANERALAPQEKRSHLLFTTIVALRYAYGTGTSDGLQLPASIVDVANGVPDVGADTTIHEVSLYVGSVFSF